MITRVGTRAAEFVGSNAAKVARMAGEAAGVEPPPTRGRRVAKVALSAAAAAAGVGAAVAASASGAKKRPAQRATGNGRASVSAGSGSKTTKQSTSTGANGRSGSKSRANRARKSAAGGAKRTAEKTRDELYELAQKADIPGRASMTKDELAKAISQ